MKDKDFVIKVNGKITKFKSHRKVIKSGNGGAVTLPKELVGKVVYVEFIKNEK